MKTNYAVSNDAYQERELENPQLSLKTVRDYIVFALVLHLACPLVAMLETRLTERSHFPLRLKEPKCPSKERIRAAPPPQPSESSRSKQGQRPSLAPGDGQQEA